MSYVCVDATAMDAFGRARAKGKPSARTSMIVHLRPKKLAPKAAVSGVRFSRDMMTIFGGPDGIRTLTFPRTVRFVEQQSFYEVKSLLSVSLNEGMKVLGPRKLTE